MRIKKRLLMLCMAVAMAIAIPTVGTNVSNVSTVEAASKVKLNKKKATLYVGKTLTLKVTGTKTKVKWSSSKKSVATVSSNGKYKGKVKAKKKGTTTITAKVGKKKYKCKVTVKNKKIPIQSVTMNKANLQLEVGETNILSVSIYPSNTTESKQVIWRSDNPKVATVDSNGLVKGIAVGKTIITAIIGSKNVICFVTVKPVHNTSITIDCDNEIVLNVGETKTINIATDNGNAILYNKNSDAISAKWGTWSGKNCTLTVTAIKEGITKLRIYDSTDSSVAKTITVTTIVPLPTISCESKKGYIYPNKYGISFRLDDYTLKFVPDNKGTYILEIYVTGACVSNLSKGYWSCDGRLLDENGTFIESETLLLDYAMVQGDKLDNYLAGKIYNIPMGNYKFQFFAKDGYCYSPSN